MTLTASPELVAFRSVVDEHRTSEQARVAARSVLANLEGLVDGGLAAADRHEVVHLAQRLSREGGDRGSLEHTAVVLMAGQLRSLLSPLDGLTASTVVSWLDDLETTG